MAKAVLHKGKHKKDRRWEQSGGAAARACASAELQPLTHCIMASPLWRRVEWRGQASVADSSTMVTLTPLCTTS